MNRDNRLLLAILVVAVALLLVICVIGAAFVLYFYQGTGPGVVAATPAGSSGRATVAVPRSRAAQTLIIRAGEPSTLDPHLLGDAESAEYVVHIFGGLVRIDENLALQPDLAEKWQISPDGTVYTFNLRKDARFHDGRLVTAQDVKYSFERALDPATGSTVAIDYLGDIRGARERRSGKASEVSGIVVIDDSTVQITIDAPKPFFLWQLTYTVAYVVDRSNVEKGGANWSAKPNGTGPFKLSSVSASEIVLVRNDSYHLTPATLREVRFRITGGGITSYEAGEIDMTPVGTADVDRVTDERDPLSKELAIVDQFSLTYLGFNTSIAPFDDVKIRQAIALAIDKKKLVSVTLKSMASEARGILPPGLPGYNRALETLTYDPARARQLVAESTYAGKAPTIMLTTGSSGGSAPASVLAIQEMIKQNTGLNVEIQLVDIGSFYAGLNARRYGMFITGWIADYPDPYDFLDILFHSKSGLNHGSYINPQVDALLDAARTERDEAKRLLLYQQAEQTLVSDAAAVPLNYAREYWLVKPYVKGVQRPPLIMPWLVSVSVEGQ